MCTVFRGSLAAASARTAFLRFFRSVCTATLNSTPQLLACDRRAVVQSAQLGPGDLWMDAAA
jgi:hypothetical protein